MESLPTALPDGVYQLSGKVRSPLPDRLTGSRRRSAKGWAKHAFWGQGQRFRVAAGQLHSLTYRCSAGTLGPRQAHAVVSALAMSLERVLERPSDVCGVRDPEEILDALFALERVTLADIADADLALSATHALGHLSELDSERDASGEPATPAPQRGGTGSTAAIPAGSAIAGIQIGDVVHSCSSGAEYVYIGEQKWRYEDTTGQILYDRWHGSSAEPIVDHVADMLARGLRVFARFVSAPRSPTLRVGDVIERIDGAQTSHYLVENVRSSLAHGLYIWRSLREDGGGAAFEGSWYPNQERHIGHVADMLQTGLAWLERGAVRRASSPRTHRTVLGHDRDGNAVHVGDVLVFGPMRLRVTGLDRRYESESDGSRVSFAHLSGPAPHFETVWLSRSNDWRVERSEPRPEPKAHQISTVDPFSLD